MSLSLRKRAESALHPAGYTPVSIELLNYVCQIDVNLYSFVSLKSSPVLFRDAKYPVDLQQIKRLTSDGARFFYVRDNEFNRISRNLFQSLDTLIQDDSVPETTRFAAVQVAVAAEVERTLQATDCKPFVEVAEQVGQGISATLTLRGVLPAKLFGIARHDFNTFTHLTNVAAYAVLLAERLGIRDGDELNQIATGAMLHDIGKRFVPTHILTKQTRLSDVERQIVRAHPQRGYEELLECEGLDFSQLMMVYQHHERVDGGGYPVGIRGNLIHPWAKLLSVVDVFDAITSYRPYRRPISRDEALQYLRALIDTHFEREVAECWINAMQQN